MKGNLKFCCSRCGKPLDGIILDYSHEWLCSKCVTDQTDVLHCERGCKVKAVNLDAGMSEDSNRAYEYLIKGKIYEVKSLDVGGWISYVTLKEIPNQKFNTVHFIRCE